MSTKKSKPKPDFKPLIEWLTERGMLSLKSEVYHTHALETSGGVLMMQFQAAHEKSYKSQTHSHCIFARFENPEAACIAFGLKPTGQVNQWGRKQYDACHARLNPHSGKWNFLGTDLNAVIDAFKCEIEPILMRAKKKSEE